MQTYAEMAQRAATAIASHQDREDDRLNAGDIAIDYDESAGYYTVTFPKTPKVTFGEDADNVLTLLLGHLVATHGGENFRVETAIGKTYNVVADCLETAAFLHHASQAAPPIIHIERGPPAKDFAEFYAD